MFSEPSARRQSLPRSDATEERRLPAQMAPLCLCHKDGAPTSLILPAMMMPRRA